MPFGLGRFIFAEKREEAQLFAGQMFLTNLKVKRLGTGEIIDCGSGLVTTAGVNLLAADWTNATAALKLAKWMDTGTGANNPAITDTGLQTPVGIARVAATQLNAANVLQVVGTITYASPVTLKEWGLFTASVAGTLWDRKSLGSVAVCGGETLQFIYSLTVVAGG